MAIRDTASLNVQEKEVADDEMDALVIADANDESAWGEPVMAMSRDLNRRGRRNPLCCVFRLYNATDREAKPRYTSPD
jgi:hypothetical protein